MPVKSFGGSRLIYASEVATTSAGGVVSGTNPNTTVSGSASGTIDPGPHASNILAGYINFTAFPTIPVSSLISKVRCTGVAVGNASGTCPVSEDSVTASASVTIANIIYPGGTTPAVDFTNASIAASDGDDLTDSFNETLAWEILYSPSITRDELITKFGSLGTYPTSGSYLYVSVVGALNISDTAPGGNGSFSSALSSWTFEVTYDLEHYTWYIFPTVVIVNGEPVQVIADQDTDIVAVAVGDDPPSDEWIPYGAIGSGPDFPSGPVFVWWQTVEFWEFYILSPLNPSISGGIVWTLVGGVPTCSGCLSLMLQDLEILVANASGVYRFTAGKTNDTLYDRASSSTIDVKIPNPSAKGGPLP